jgi:CheY-like chemotaxis protein
MRPVVVMDSHNSSSYNNYTSERSDYDDYYPYENGNNDSNNAENIIQLLTTDVIGQKEKNNNNNNKEKDKSSSNQITSSSSILARILIVDDEPDVNLLLKMVLEGVNGFKVDSFIDPESALQYFKSGLYDLAILDIKMPKIDGFELCRKICKMDNNVRVCFLSAGEMYHERFRSKQLYTSDLDCFFFLQKPISNEVLRKVVDKILS